MSHRDAAEFPRVDDHCRLAYAEFLPGEKGATCAGFLIGAADYFAARGIGWIGEVMTDNHVSCKHSTGFAEVIAALGARHVFIKPHRPWQNGKVGRFDRTGWRWAGGCLAPLDVDGVCEAVSVRGRAAVARHKAPILSRHYVRVLRRKADLVGGR